MVFSCSARWWPYCETQLHELPRVLADYQHSGIAIFTISDDSVAALSDFARRHRIEYPLLSDEGRRVITALGMLNERVCEQHAFYGVARTAPGPSE